MNPDGLLNALRKFPVNISGDLVNSLATLWNTKTGWAIGTSAPSCLHLADGAQKIPWFAEELGVMKQYGQQLE